MTRAHVSELASLYRELDDWPQKDLVIHMLQDVETADIRPILQDGLRSPSVESRAVCLCLLHPGTIRFDHLLENGRVSPKLVDQAVAQVANHAADSTE